MIRDVPFSGTFYVIYRLLKNNLKILYNSHIKDHTRIESEAEHIKHLAIISSISSFSANMVSCAITHPLDLVRTRIYFGHYNNDQI